MARRCSCAAPSLRLTGDRAGAREALQPRRRQARNPCAAARSPRSSGCARRSSATSPRSRKTRATAAEADTLYRQAVALLDANYPGSAALLNAKARLAGYLARTGQPTTAEAMFRDIVHSQPDSSNLPPSFAKCFGPTSTAAQEGRRSRGEAEIFAATQLMVRPGLAQTQAVLARELTGGTDEASRLFRQSVTLTRAGRARPRSSLRGCRTSPSRRRRNTARARVLRAALDHRRRSSSPPRRRCRASRATAPYRATRSRSPTCRRSCARAKPITA